MKVGIVGVGMIPWQVRYPDKTYYELALEAVDRAFNDIAGADVFPVTLGEAVKSEALFETGIK